MIARIARFFGYVPAPVAPTIPAPGAPMTSAEYEAAKQRVRGLLSDTRWTWRKLETIARKARITEETATDILEDIGARGSRDNATRTFPIYRLR